MEETKFRSQAIENFLDALGSTASIPGGGAAAAELGATACALAEKTARITLANKNYAAVHEEAARWASLFHEARDILLDLMDEDAKNFNLLMELYKKFKKEGKSEAEIEEAMQDIYQKAAEAPAQMATVLADLSELFTEVLHKGNKNLLSDSIMAAQFAMGAIHAAILNVRINLKSVRNDFFVHEAEESIKTWENAVSAIDAVLTYQVTL